jgi:hypothetical protein
MESVKNGQLVIVGSLRSCNVLERERDEIFCVVVKK